MSLINLTSKGEIETDNVWENGLELPALAEILFLSLYQGQVQSSHMDLKEEEEEIHILTSQ